VSDRSRARSPAGEQPPAAPQPHALETVVGLIASRAEASGGWTVQSTEVRDSLGLTQLDYYRALYAAATADRSVLDLGDITGGFSSEAPEVLLAVLEVFCGAQAEPRLARAGIFFPHSNRVDILETFVGTMADAVAAHALDPEAFGAMLRSFRRFDSARAAYIAEHFPLRSIIEEAVERYCGCRDFDIPALARANVSGLIAFFFRRHVLEEAALFAGVSARLYRIALDQGYAQQAERPATEEPPDPFEAARRVLGVAGLPLSRTVLRDRYRALMKRYHPDVNPRGLDKAQEINAAYSLLLSTLTG
jgi:hypothetical protein